MLNTSISYQLKAIAITYYATNHKPKKLWCTETKLSKVKNKKNILKIFYFGPILSSSRAIPQSNDQASPPIVST